MQLYVRTCMCSTVPLSLATFATRGIILFQQLTQVADQIETAGGDTAAVVLVLTDGDWQDVKTTQEQVIEQCNRDWSPCGFKRNNNQQYCTYLQAQNLSKSGARLFGIGVGDSVDEQQVRK